MLPNQIKVNYDKRSDVIQNATRFDFYNYLQEDILVKVDRSSMLNSLEIRSPFLDHRLIEFAFKYIPTNLKVNSSNKKIVLKEMCKRLLPKDFDLRRKQGFEIPLSNWLKNDLKFRQLYFDTLLSEDSIFNNLYVKRLFTGQLRGYQNSEKILGILLFELWRKKYSIKINQ